jgi:hypothetical protein
MWGSRVDPYLSERPDAFGVLVGVPPKTNGEQHDMIVGKWGEGNKTSLHMVVDIDFHHK